MGQSFPIMVEKLGQLFGRNILNRGHSLLAFLRFGEWVVRQGQLRLTDSSAFLLAQTHQKSQYQKKHTYESQALPPLTLPTLQILDYGSHKDSIKTS
jgi:hypothetical protein